MKIYSYILKFLILIAPTSIAKANDVPLSFMPNLTSICISTDATGFNWKNKKWSQTNFYSNNKYLISKISYEKYNDEVSRSSNKLWTCQLANVSLDMTLKDKKFTGFVSACYDIKEFGEKSDLLNASMCDEFWDEGQLLRISCNKHSPQMFFHPDGNFIRYPWHSDIRGDVTSKDSLVLKVGTCSSLR